MSDMKADVVRMSATLRGRSRVTGKSAIGCEAGPAERTSTRSDIETAECTYVL